MHYPGTHQTDQRERDPRKSRRNTCRHRDPCVHTLRKPIKSLNWKVYYILKGHVGQKERRKSLHLIKLIMKYDKNK